MTIVPAIAPGRWPARPQGFGAALHDLTARINKRERPMSPAAAACRFNFLQFRFFEIDRLARYRASAGIRIDEAKFAFAVSACIEPNRAAQWVRRWAPTIGPDDFGDIVDEACGGVFLSATALGNMLGLTPDERTNLDIRTMRPAGMSPSEFGEMRRNRKKANDKDRAKARRRAAGIPERRKGDRVAAEAAALGISRSTLFARKKAARLAAVPEPDPNVAQGNKSICDVRVQLYGAVQMQAPAWLETAFKSGRCVVSIDDPTISPHAARFGGFVMAVAALHRAGRAAA